MTMMHTTTIDGACTAGHSEGKPPDPLYNGPHCTCTQPGTVIKIDGELYRTVNRIKNAGCPEHGMESSYIPKVGESLRDKHTDAKAHTATGAERGE